MTLLCNNPNTDGPIPCQRRVAVKGGPCGVTHRDTAPRAATLLTHAVHGPALALLAPIAPDGADVDEARDAWREAQNRVPAYAAFKEISEALGADARAGRITQARFMSKMRAADASWRATDPEGAAAIDQATREYMVAKGLGTYLSP